MPGATPFESLAKLRPKHQLGASLLNGDELRSNIEMGKIAQSQATVHALQPGITGSGVGAQRKGRKGRAR